jgi:hypothetical protein
VGLVKKQAPTRTTAAKARSGMDENASPLRRQVLMAARRRCDDMQDGPEAREQMQRDVLDTPAELLADLLTALSTVRITRTDLFHPTTTKPERSNP